MVEGAKIELRSTIKRRFAVAGLIDPLAFQRHAEGVQSKAAAEAKDWLCRRWADVILASDRQAEPPNKFKARRYESSQNPRPRTVHYSEG
jgi:hypothetical protein